ncbi:hypothetical protein KSW27_01140 [Holdemanella biformis]|uniref:hypothetical protein n=1 Tax=Holdemanella biformis TaxID=1735 RepID=UPI001C27D9F5|nr:hypothetical protein [Holdemanella biformis]MBU9894858.1 hypothetical protein [Holdemanella biformis]MBV3415900.1 hypothetical protein [Holdemanella biformis]
MDEYLLGLIKTDLGYKWCDDATNEKLKHLIAEGLAYLKKYSPSADFQSDEFARSLLKNYVLYALSNATDDFKVNYREDIMLFRDEWSAKNVNQETIAN